MRSVPVKYLHPSFAETALVVDGKLDGFYICYPFIFISVKGFCKDPCVGWELLKDLASGCKVVESSGRSYEIRARE